MNELNNNINPETCCIANGHSVQLPLPLIPSFYTRQTILAVFQKGHCGLMRFDWSLLFLLYLSLQTVNVHPSS